MVSDTFRFVSNSEEDTKTLAKKISATLMAGDIVCLSGELGAGKTTFVKGLAEGLHIKENKVNSPTFVFMNVYSGKKGKNSVELYHFDLYRATRPEDVFTLDYEEYFYGQGICVVEWAERLGPLMPKKYLQVNFAHQGDQRRAIEVAAVSVK